MLQKNYIDSYDNHPFNYAFSIEDGMNCDQPLYMLNHFSFAGKIRREKYAQRMDIIKGYSGKIWILILISLLCYVFTSLIIQKFETNKLSVKKTLSTISAYLQPFINCGECRKPFTLIYLFWLISIFPLVEIFKNDLLANLVALNETKIQTIQQLIASNNTPYNSYGIQFMLLNFESYFTDPEFSLKDELRILNMTSKRHSSIFEDRLKHENELTPELLSKFFDSATFIEDENGIETANEMLKRFFNSYIADEKYFPFMVTSICYRPNFPHKNITHIMFVYFIL
jgi:hypothetical protein